MLENIRNNELRILLVALLVLGLIIVRMFEDLLFYDPFLKYYRLDTNLPFPQYNTFRLFFDILFRYIVNTGLSLAIIYIIFKDFGLTKFASILYLVNFLILIVAFFVMLELYGQRFKLELFYVRRFLIQPILLLLFLPAFYFQKVASKK